MHLSLLIRITKQNHKKIISSHYKIYIYISFLNKTHFPTLNVLVFEIIERMKIIMVLNYIVGRDFLMDNNFASQKARKIIFK